MFYGQNCSGRLGERKGVICVAGSKNDYGFVRLLNELNLKNIKRNLNRKHFSVASKLAKKYGISISIVVIPSNQFGRWKSKISDYPKWFGKLYGIICYKAVEKIIGKPMYIHMDREYDSKTLDIATETLIELLNSKGISIKKDNIYIRKEREYPSHRIIVADLFARGCFREFGCNSSIVNKKLDIKNEIKQIFRRTR